MLDGPDGYVIAGTRCRLCGHPGPVVAPRCPRCGGEVAEARFGPEGAVWATTTIHVPSGGRAAPYTLTYVDLDDGPRVLAHVKDGPTIGLRVAERVRLCGLSDRGDPLVAVLR